MIVIVGTPFDFRMGYGKRIGRDLKLVQIDMGYATVGKNRDVDLGIVGHPGAILGAVLQAATGRIKNDKRKLRQQWMTQLSQAEDAATFYTSVFANSKIVDVARYGAAGPRSEGTVMTVSFELDGQKFPGLKAQASDTTFWPWGRARNRLVDGADNNVWHYYNELIKPT